MSEQEFLFPETSDSKCSLLQMVFVMEDQVNHFRNRACFVRSTIYIVHWDGLPYFDQVKTTTFGIVSINEFTSGSTVY